MYNPENKSSDSDIDRPGLSPCNTESWFSPKEAPDRIEQTFASFAA
jgi:hypothetical protein